MTDLNLVDESETPDGVKRREKFIAIISAFALYQGPWSNSLRSVKETHT